MSKKDTIIRDNFIILDVPRPVRLSMRSVFRLEEVFGGVSEALTALRLTEDEAEKKRITAEFLSAMAAVPRDVIDEQLEIKDLINIIVGLAETIDNHLYKTDKDNEENQGEGSTSGGYDWDELLFFAWKHLNMSETEFWKSTPRKFFKFADLYRKSLGIKDDKEKRGTRESRLNSQGL